MTDRARLLYVLKNRMYAQDAWGTGQPDVIIESPESLQVSPPLDVDSISKE